jgi:hypothetical protein
MKINCGIARGPDMNDGGLYELGESQTSTSRFDVSKFDWGKRLHQEGIHPVLIFGTSESGKSTMLLSLLSYGQQCAEIAAHVCEKPILPQEHPDAKKNHSEANAFFIEEVRKFQTGNLTYLTQREDPLFIPIEIKPEHEEKSIRFAFLEGDGEWYTMQPVEDKNNFQPIPELKKPIAQILNSYPAGLSMIFVVPTFEVNPQKRIETSRQSISNLLTKIGSKRADMSPADNHLLLLSMWDGRHPPGSSNGHFYGATSDVALDALGGGSSGVWAAFTRLTGEGGKAMMPFSAAWINNKVVIDNEHHKPIFDRFNRTLWNWLYGNASQSATANSDDAVGRRRVLFPDVVVPDPSPRPWHEGVTRSLFLSRF